MSWRSWLKGGVGRYGSPVPTRLAETASPDAGVVAQTREGVDRINALLPRGIDVIRERIDRKEAARWARPHEIGTLAFTGGHQVLLGKYAGRLIGRADDKPLVTIASARSGKTSSVLKPVLLTYEGSMLVMDPKGELAADTAAHRRGVLGQEVHILDPFGCSGEAASPFNPLAELDPLSDTIVDDVDVVAQALIVEEAGSDGSHWTNSAQSLLRGLLLHTLQKPLAERHLVTARELLTLTHADLLQLKSELERKGAADPTEAVQTALFLEMASQGAAYGGALAAAGTSFLRKNPRERSSIVSTAEVQTRLIDSVPMRRSLAASCVRLADLGERPMTLYLCLPAGMMQSHFRWLRLIVRLALLAMERRGPWPRGRTPCLFMCEEFSVLGHMPLMESAAALFPGFGVKLWVVLQDTSQLQRHYKESWQTFLGNAGILQAFANADKATLDYLSGQLGSLSFVRGAFGAGDDDKSKSFVDKERLAYQHEIARAFAREQQSQLLLVEGHHPMAIERLSHEDVERIRRLWRPVASPSTQ